MAAGRPARQRAADGRAKATAAEGKKSRPKGAAAPGKTSRPKGAAAPGKTSRPKAAAAPGKTSRPKAAAAPGKAGAKRKPAGRGTRLREYRAKRDFSATPEPAPERRPAGATTRFVIHQHDARRLHWDFRLERDGVLASWAVPKGIPEAPKDNRLAVWTEDHPVEYLDFSGVIPKGQYGAGTMEIWDHGTYETLKWEPRKIEVWLHGERLDARYALFPIDKDEPPKNWMIHRMDAAVDPDREPMPSHLTPMMARAGQLPADERNWAFEIKWDGVRAIAYSQPGELRLESRNLKDITDSYPDLAGLGRALGSHSAVLDGEIVAFDAAGRPSFEALQPRMHISSRSQAKRLAAGTPVTYVIFDLLWLDGHSLMELPYTERRERLAQLKLTGERWQTPEHVVGEGEALLAASTEQRLEGIVAKELDSPYLPGQRGRCWVKIKTVARQELVVGGWMPGKGKRVQSIGALLLGVYDPDGAFRYAGRVGTGFTERELARLGKLLEPLRREASPFTAGPKPPRGASFCEPRLVAEIEFREWTREGSLRAPSYKGLRHDKRPQDVMRERSANGAASPSGPPVDDREADAGAAVELPDAKAKSAQLTVQGRELKLSNLDKLLYPKAKLSKREVIGYYAAIAPVLLPHLQGRALTVTRWPDGVDAKSFFQKQTPAHAPAWVQTVNIPQKGKPIDYTVVEDLPTLVWLANLAAIELHTPLARAEQRERPTTLVFDLDPGAPASIVECCRVGLMLRGMFENLGLETYAKTSGSKGLQLYVPLNNPDVTFEQTKPFALAVAELLEQAEPDLVVSRMTKARRRGKVLIDWSQNDRNKTTVCAYSLRAVERPTVSTPVEWDEVAAVCDGAGPAALSFEHGQVLERVTEQGDLFAPVLSSVQRLPAL